MKTYDLIIVGSGAALKIARPAAKQGKKVAVIEKEKLGGTCLNRGCLPSKMLIHPADVAQEIYSAYKYHIKTDTSVSIDFAKLTSEIAKKTDSTSEEIKTLYEQMPNLDYYNSNAYFVKDKILEVNEEHITADTIVLGIGARPMILPIPGLENVPYWTSTQALRSQNLPKDLIIIGGGYIGVELAHAYGSLGSQIHMITKGGLITRADSDVREEFTTIMNQRYSIYDVDTKYIWYDQDNQLFHVDYEENGEMKTIKGDGLLIATGVIPNTDKIGIENTSIRKSQRGFLEVDEYMQTSVEKVYALGDCVGNYMFRHSANFEAEYLRDKILNSTNNPIVYPPMPWSIFTHPQIAGVGYREQDLKECVVGKASYKDSGQGDALRSEYGFVKLLFCPNSKKLLGASIIGEHASIMIHICSLLQTQGATLDDFFSFIYVHPALPEIIRNAARDAKHKFRDKNI